MNNKLWNMEQAKQILRLVFLVAYALGAIGGTGYALYSRAYVIAIAVVVLAVLAFPVVKKIFQDWTK